MALPCIPKATVIPRLLHQVYVGSELPSILKKNIENLKALNPGWGHTLYDDAAIVRFISEHYGRDYLNYYFRINKEYGAARSDFFRYLLMYRLGGVYLDVKSNVNRPLDEIILPDDQYIISQWKNEAGALHAGMGLQQELEHVPGGEFQQWYIITVPGHPFLRAVIEAVVDNIERYSVYSHKTARTGVFRTTGPIVYTKTIAPLLHRFPCRIVDNETSLGLRYSMFDDKGALAHVALGGTHYSELTTPVVSNTGVRLAIDLTYIGLRRRFRALRSRLGQGTPMHGSSH